MRAFVQSFRVQDARGAALERTGGAALVAEALAGVPSGRTEDGPLNALVLDAGLRWLENGAPAPSAYVAAAFQTLPGLGSAGTGAAVLQAESETGWMPGRHVPKRMDSAGPGSGDARYAELRAAYLEALGAIDNIADDRLARALLGMVEATVRTDYFREPPAPYIALKLRARASPICPTRRRFTKSTSTAPQCRDVICVRGVSRAAVSAIATGPTTFAPKSST